MKMESCTYLFGMFGNNLPWIRVFPRLVVTTYFVLILSAFVIPGHIGCLRITYVIYTLCSFPLVVVSSSNKQVLASWPMFVVNSSCFQFISDDYIMGKAYLDVEIFIN